MNNHENLNVNEIELQDNSYKSPEKNKNSPNYAKLQKSNSNSEKDSNEQNREIDLGVIGDVNVNNNNQYIPDEFDRPERFEVPPHLKKTFICTVVLAGLGLILFILGFIKQVEAADPGKGITFWTLGAIVMVPGGYYSYKFYKAKKALDRDERDDILDEIPEL